MAKKRHKYIGKDASKKLKGCSINLHEEDEKYSVKQYVQIYKGYDMLQNLHVTRTYIQKRYKIDWILLELLLQLMGLRIFTVTDYTSLPKDFSLSRFRTIREKGWVQIIQDNHSAAHHVYGLSTKGKNICIKFYKILSGEIPIPESGSVNPMAKKSTQNAYDKKKMLLIEKLNKLPTKEHFKTLF